MILQSSRHTNLTSSFLQIPSTYAPERLELLRQLEKVKQMAASAMDSDEEVDGDK